MVTPPPRAGTKVMQRTSLSMRRARPETWELCALGFDGQPRTPSSRRQETQEARNTKASSLSGTHDPADVVRRGLPAGRLFHRSDPNFWQQVRRAPGPTDDHGATGGFPQGFVGGLQVARLPKMECCPKIPVTTTGAPPGFPRPQNVVSHWYLWQVRSLLTTKPASRLHEVPAPMDGDMCGPGGTAPVSSGESPPPPGTVHTQGNGGTGIAFRFDPELPRDLTPAPLGRAT